MTGFRHFDVERRGELIEIRFENPAFNDAAGYAELAEELAAFVEQERPRKLLVCFSAVQYCSTAVMRALLKTKSRLDSEGGRMKLYGMNEPVRNSFQMLNLEGAVFDIHSSEASAVEALEND